VPAQRAPDDKSLMSSDGLPPSRPPAPPSEDRKSILDLFRN
jgi:penicillin-binding protein 1A